MITLSEMQTRMRDAILAREPKQLDDILGSSAKRFEIHRRHFISSITAALEKTFPAVVSLVDRRFFAYAADTFIRSMRPRSPCLAEYGAELPEFLAGFPACANLPYLADVARLEWAIHAAYHSADSSRDEDSVFDASVHHLASRFPVHRIWNVALGRRRGDRSFRRARAPHDPPRRRRRLNRGPRRDRIQISPCACRMSRRCTCCACGKRALSRIRHRRHDRAAPE
jgi:hypothetical protein